MELNEKKGSVLVLGVVLFMVLVGTGVYFFGFRGITGNVIYSQGDGSFGNPYVITNCSQLQEMRQCLDCHYVLGDDVDCSETKEWNWNETRGVYEGFEPVGYDLGGGMQLPTNPFIGTLEGNNFIISELYINRTNKWRTGVFGTSYGNISNLFINNLSVFSNTHYVGGLVGWQYFGSISNVHIIGMITGSPSSNVGGIVGRFDQGIGILNSSFQGDIIGRYGTGGLVGNFNNGGVIGNSFSNVNISAPTSMDVGGLGGIVTNSEIIDSYSISNIVADGRASLLIGSIGSSYLINSWAEGNVSGKSSLGGLIGYNINPSLLIIRILFL
jgi:hypothetical protein